MAYTVYKTVNKLNGKFYIGVHKTDNPNDEYLGSGTMLMNAVRKYGKENFEKTVLYICESSFDAYALEEWLVERYGIHPMCVNLRQGGVGGFDHLTEFNKGCVAIRERCKSDPAFRDVFRKLSLAALKKVTPEGKERSTKHITEYARTHPVVFTDEMKKQASISRIGDKNPQFGKIWVTDGVTAKQIRSDELTEFEKDGWTRGKIRRLPKAPRQLKPSIHGTPLCYKRDQCRCDECVESYRKYYRDAMKKRYSATEHRYILSSSNGKTCDC